jgi:hypothetical protein
MWQTRERLSPDAAAASEQQQQQQQQQQQEEEAAAAAWLSLGEAELLWDYPNPDQLDGDMCRMGFPDWRRMLVEPLLDACAAATAAAAAAPADSGAAEEEEEGAGGGGAQILERRCVDRWFSSQEWRLLKKAAVETGVLKKERGVYSLYNALRRAAAARSQSRAADEDGKGEKEGEDDGGELSAADVYSDGAARLWRRLAVVMEFT